MKARSKTIIVFIVWVMNFLIIGCDTTRTIYKQSISKNEYFTINAVTLSHCGCSHIYADNYKNGKLTFQIFYNDNIARKTIFDYTNNSKKPKLNSLLATSLDNFTTPFDSLDLKIFNAIDSAILKKEGIVYPVRWTKYKGYVTDTLLNQNQDGKTL